jgi:hypothetical protein
MLKATVVVVLLALLGGCATGGGTRSLEAAPVLAAMPADNATEEARLSAELLALGDEAVLEVCRSLVPMGAGDDTAGRFALAGLSTYVARPGAEEERQAYASILLRALDESAEREVQAFFIRQLELVGADESVAGISAYLADAELVDPATRALVAIGTPNAQAALLAALPAARGTGRTTLVKALGELRTKAAVYEITKFTLAEDEDLRQAALYALANIGPVTGDDLLAEAAARHAPYRRSQTTSYLLLYARRLIEAGETERGAQICRDLVATRRAPEERNVRIAALNTLVEMLGDGALEDLTAAVDIPDLQLTEAALRIGAEMPGPAATDAWLTKLQNVDGEVHDKIRAMLLAREGEDSSPRLENAKAAWAIAAASLEGPSGAGGTADVEEEGFTTLFNGTDLTGWQGDTARYVAEDGMIVIHPEIEDPEIAGGGGNLYTAEQYTDFVFRFEFRLTPGGNNGLGIRAPLEGDAAYVGMELQILDNRAEQYADLKDYQYHGSIYGTYPAKRGFQRPAGQWNYQEVIVLGRRVIVILNGTVIVDADIDLASTPATPDGRDHPGLSRRRGHIGFLGHGSRVEFRNIRIKELAGF